MLLNELAVAHHLRATPYRYNEKLLENNGLRLKRWAKCRQRFVRMRALGLAFYPPYGVRGMILMYEP